MKKEIPKDEFMRKRTARQKKVRKRRLTAFFVFFIIMLLCIGAVLSFTVFFPIEKIAADGSKIYTDSQIISISGVEIGDNLFAVNKATVEKNLKKNLPYVDSITLKRELPGSLKIQVKDAEEFACYEVDNKFYTISKSGWVLKEETKSPKKLLLITLDGVKCEVGSKIDFGATSRKELIERICNSLSNEKIVANAVNMSDNITITLKVENRFDVVLGTSNNIEEKINHLRGMLKEISDKKSGKIDLSMWTSDNKKGSFIEKND